MTPHWYRDPERRASASLLQELLDRAGDVVDMVRPLHLSGIARELRGELRWDIDDALGAAWREAHEILGGCYKNGYLGAAALARFDHGVLAGSFASSLVFAHALPGAHAARPALYRAAGRMAWAYNDLAHLRFALEDHRDAVDVHWANGQERRGMRAQDAVTVLGLANRTHHARATADELAVVSLGPRGRGAAHGLRYALSSQGLRWLAGVGEHQAPLPAGMTPAPARTGAPELLRAGPAPSGRR